MEVFPDFVEQGASKMATEAYLGYAAGRHFVKQRRYPALFPNNAGTTVKFVGWQGGAEFFERGILKRMLSEKNSSQHRQAAKSAVGGLFIYE